MGRRDFKNWPTRRKAKNAIVAAAYVSFSIRFQAFRPLYGR